MNEPVIDYGQRAGAREKPAIWVEPAEPLNLFAQTRAEGMLYSATGQTFNADASIWQPLVDGTYPYPVLGFRADTGGSTDSHAAGNWAYCEQNPDHIRIAIPYVVFKPGQRQAIMTRLRNLFGSQCPPNIVPEIDMESGPRFAGPGDHSAEANALAADLAAWTGSQDRVQGYANAPDWASSWPSRPAWMKRRLAWYSANAWPPPAGIYTVQYYGALPYSSPPGFPRTCAPFGSFIDMNATPRTVDQMESDYGIAVAPPPDPPHLLEDPMTELWLLRGTSAGFWLNGGKAVTSNSNQMRKDFIAQGGKVYFTTDTDEFNRVKNAYS